MLRVFFALLLGNFLSFGVVLGALPIQASVADDSLYSALREQAAKSVGVYTNECAKFVNRIFFLRFGAQLYGNAWDMQLASDTQPFLSLVWQIPEESFDRKNYLALLDRKDRVRHFQSLYDAIAAQKRPLGVVGFVYRFSAFRDQVAQMPGTLPQTHVAFLAGKKTFTFQNTSEKFLTLREILEQKYGVIHDFEEDFVASRVPLGRVLLPGEAYAYEDYLLEEQFKIVRSQSLLEAFLRKHVRNRITALVRPVSFSALSSPLLAQLNHQEQQLSSFGGIRVVTARKYSDLDFLGKAYWEEILVQEFGIEDPKKVLFVPIPEKVRLVTAQEVANEG